MRKTEYWLDRVNGHLEKLLKRDKRDKKFQRHMATHYYIENQVYKVKVKQLKEKLKETLIKQKEKGNFDILDYASLIA